MINKVILVGRITKDPEVRYTQTGVASVSFSVAVERTIKDAQGERQADFINCVAWRNTAEFISKYIKKGYMMAVEGRIQTRSYQSTVDNQTRYVTEVVCDSVSNLQPRDPNSQPNNFGQNNTQFQQPQQAFGNTNYQQNQNSYFANQPKPFQQQPQTTTLEDSYSNSSISMDVADDDLPF